MDELILDDLVDSALSFFTDKNMERVINGEQSYTEALDSMRMTTSAIVKWRNQQEDDDNATTS